MQLKFIFEVFNNIISVLLKFIRSIKKNKMKKNLLLVIILVSFASISIAQLSNGGEPKSFSFETKSNLNQVNYEIMPYVDEDALRAEDEIVDQVGGVPWRFGYNIEVDYNPDNSGVWDYLPGGDKIWRLGISSENAKSINLTFDRYYLPQGAELFIYNEDRTKIIGAFTHENNQDHGYFATTLIAGSTLIIEYYEPQKVTFPGELNISIVTHGYRGTKDFMKALGDSGPCNVNVACPLADGWEDQINSVAMMVSGGNGFCTGSLINNTSNDGTPYFLTANHCYSGNPATWVFWFNWQSATCNNPGSSPSYNSLTGATLRSRNAASDFCLLELNNMPPESFGAFWAGWNRTTVASLSETLIGVHHPSGDIKKFSYATGGVTTANYLGNTGSGTTHWRIVWSGGTTTEPGSSGSALFDSNGRIIGQLHGGYAACGNTQPDWYGKFGVSWTGGGSNATRLSNWLDTNSTGATILDGIDPYSVVCSPPTNQASNFSANSIGDNQITVNFNRGNGTNVLVVTRQGSAVNANPNNGTNYTANANFGSGNQIGTGNYVVYKGTGNSVTVTGLNQGTTYHFAIYEFFVADNCYNTTALTGNATTTGAAPCTYCNVAAPTDDNTGVTRVQFNTIDNTSTGAPAYTNFTHISTNLTVGESYPISVRVNTDGNYTARTKVWIDWNQNCQFDAGEEYDLGSATNQTNGLTSLSPLSITVPANAVLGTTTMRVRTTYIGQTGNIQPLACGDQNYSEAEDYSINVLAGGVDPCPAISSYPWNENFNQAALPECWTVQNGHASNNWASTTGYTIGETNILPQSGSHFWYVQWIAQNQNELLITPEFDFSALTNPQIRFWFKGSYHWSVENDFCDLELLVRVNGGAWTSLWSEHDHTGFSDETLYQWLETVVNLSAYEGQSNLQFAYRYTGNNGANFGVDNITIEGTQTQQYTLTVNTNGSGAVTVNGNPYTGPVTVNEGTSLSLQANPAGGWQFDNWTGALTGATNPQNLTMDGNKTVTANFSEIPPQQYTLTVSTIGDGTVTVNGNPYTAPVTVNAGTVLSLQANPSSGYLFSQWSGHLSGATNPQNLTMDGNKNVSAEFILSTQLVEGNSNSGISIYPNPARELINISALERIEKIAIHDVLGKNIMVITPEDYEAEINITRLESGMYFVTVYTENSYSIHKLQKSK